LGLFILAPAHFDEAELIAEKIERGIQIAHP
jgi:hypothetical protein